MDKKKRALEQIGKTIVMHRQFEAAHRGVLDLVTLATSSGVPFGATVLGPSGVGKSTLVAAILSKLQSTDLLGERMEALHLSVQSTPSVGQVIGGMLTQLSFPPVVRPARMYEQSEDLIRAIKERRIKLIFLNESQHLTMGQRGRSTTNITDYLKLVIEETNVVTVVLGLPTFGHLKDINEQLHSRAPARFPLDAFKFNEDWAALLKGLSSGCSAICLDVVHESLSKPLYRATEGLMRPLKQLLTAAVSHALDQGKTAVDQQSFHSAYQLLFNGTGTQVNPFKAAS